MVTTVLHPQLCVRADFEENLFMDTNYAEPRVHPACLGDPVARLPTPIYMSYHDNCTSCPPTRF